MRVSHFWKTAFDAGIDIVTFQSNRGGTLINPKQRKGFITGIQESLDMAVEMNTKKMFVLTDELGDDRSVKFQFPDLSEEQKYQSVLDGLKEIAPLSEKSRCDPGFGTAEQSGGSCRVLAKEFRCWF